MLKYFGSSLQHLVVGLPHAMVTVLHRGCAKRLSQIESQRRSVQNKERILYFESLSFPYVALQ